jgi:hypothetical protein
VKRIVEKAELVVREVVRYEWGPFDTEALAINAAIDAQASLELSPSEARCRTQLASWVLVEHPAGEWVWLSSSRVEHRQPGLDDMVALS